MIVQLRPTIAETQGRMLRLESATTDITKTLSTVAAVVNGWRSDQVQLQSKVDGWRSDQVKLESKVDVTAANLVQLQKQVDQLQSGVAAKSSKRGHNRSRSPLVRCHYSTVRYNQKMDGKLRKGDEVWLVPPYGVEPTLKRFVRSTNGRSSELCNDRACSVRCGQPVPNEQLFIKSVSQVCRRRW